MQSLITVSTFWNPIVAFTRIKWNNVKNVLIGFSIELDMTSFVVVHDSISNVVELIFYASIANHPLKEILKSFDKTLLHFEISY